MLKQQLQLKLTQKLSPQQIQLMKLVQLPTLAFEQRVKEELEENPALEATEHQDREQEEAHEDEYDTPDEYEDNQIIQADAINVDEYLSDDEIPDYRLYANNYHEEDAFGLPYREEVSFHQYLIEQLNTFRLGEKEREIAEFLVGSINDNGYIRRSMSDIADDLAFTQNIYTDEKEVEHILKTVIFQLDPAGIGARDLQESLIVQLKHKPQTAITELAITILTENFDIFSKKHYDKLIQKYNISEETLKEVIQEVEKLNPKPGSSYAEGSKFTEQVVPDFTVTINDGELELSLNGRNTPELHVSQEYTEMFKTYRDSTDKDKQKQKEAVEFIKQKLDAAKWFIDAIKQRQNTLLVTMNAIMLHQKDYFLTGDETKIKPLILKDIAESIGMDISTYEVKKILQTIIEGENKRKPYTDDKLMELLKEKGYPIARRTIAKYREQLDIPVARLRKEL